VWEIFIDMGKKKLKIAFAVVKNISRGGGIEKYTLELGRRLVSRGHEVTVFSMGHYGNSKAIVEGMRVVKVPSIPGSSFEKLSAGFTATLKALSLPRDTILHFHATGPGLFAWLPRLLRYKCVLQLHGIEWQRSRWNKATQLFLKIIERFAMKQSSICTAVSKVQCEYVAQKYCMSAVYISTGAEIKTVLEPNEIIKLGLQRNRYILFASRIVPEKGAHYLIQAFKRLNTDLKLVVAGDAVGVDDYKLELRNLAGGDSRILFPGFVEGQALQELFGNAAFYVHPSEIEGLSIALLEAMSFGLCCLTSDIPENREAIGEAGLTFRNMDIDDLAGQMQRLLNNQEMCKQIGSLARTRVSQEFSWDSITDKFEELYFNLTDK